MTRAIGYLRVSTQEQLESGAGLAAQRAGILGEATRRGWEEVQFIEDAGYSAKDLRRPGIQLALEALRRGRADVLVVSKLDRLSRSLIDFAGVMERATRERWALVALDLGVDTGSISGRAVASVMATFSQLEREMIGQRTREALAVRRAAGIRLGRPREVDDATVRRIVAHRADGASLADIAEELERDRVPTARGGRWHPSTVARVLRSVESAGERSTTSSAGSRPGGRSRN